VLGFLIFNVNPASIFMGDSGSMFIGFLLAVVPLRLASQGRGSASLLIPVLGLGLPIADTLLSMIRRALAGRPLFSADKEHIHHRVLRRVGGSQRRAVALLFAACSAFGAAGAVLAFLRGAPAIALLAGVTVSAMYLLQRLGCFGSSADLRLLRERNRRLRALARELRHALAGCRSSHEVGAALGRVATPLGCRLEISLDDEGGLPQRLAFRHGEVPLDARGVDWRCAVLLAGRQVGEVRATWSDGRTEVDRDEERFLEALLVHIAWALSRQRSLVPRRRGTGSFEGT
jgi:UDP-GlcNAc:undecaprenyl-phosphate GlcNAc-1-phosphate transferase